MSVDVVRRNPHAKSQRTEASRAAIVALSVLAPGFGSLARGRFAQGLLIYGALQLTPQLLQLEARTIKLGLRCSLVAALCVTALGTVLALRGADSIQLSRHFWFLLAVALLVHPVVFAANLWFLAPIAPFQVPSESMSPTLKTGDFFWIVRRHWPAREVARGDVIVFDEAIYGAEIHVVKRVVATGGQEIDACHGHVIVDGTVLDEAYVHYKTGSSGITPQEYCHMVVPEGHVYVMGDFRGHSMDSRSRGAVSLDAVRGRALYIFESRSPHRVGAIIR